MKLQEFEQTSRAKRGVVMLRELKKHPHRIVGMVITNNHETAFVESEKGAIESIAINELRFNDRYSNGSFILDEEENGSIIHLWTEKND